MDKQINGLAPERPFLIMTLILGEHQCQKFTRIAKEKNIRSGTVVLGRGTVNSATLNLLGIKSQKKQIVNVLLERERANQMLDLLTREFQLHQPGHGIVFTSPIITAAQIMNNAQGAWDAPHHMEEKSVLKKLTVVVNRGMAEDVMDIVRKLGVKGGTILHGRGTGSEVTAKLLGMEIESEKELVMILMPSDLVEKVVHALYQELQLAAPGNGILFVEPVLDARGLIGAPPSSQGAQQK